MVVGIVTDADMSNLYSSSNQSEFVATLVLGPDTPHELELRGDMCSKDDNLYELAFVQPTLEHAMADDVVLGRNITRMASISS
ncbi:hypothetical protein H257_12977 [Aphanomyces astaci]|uniref:Uncharacterized protein n=1 Tax=Aphanomyces astaci TaxID=112090 RepID=W4FWH0_APHAT|nr:hypothetical protein H257_12977 [Aphanomyces astaci]ETV71842.1 hypothetical protein H257_12977 [Aphanomyces astaci]|eukprot:XP_009838691.1 hypothetical protein H257_12977 [Aphanomyces astaci]